MLYLGFRPERALPLIFLGFTVFALCFQGSFYLFEYRNGGTLAPTYFKLLKDAGFVVALSLIIWTGLTQKHRADALPLGNLFLISFCFLVTLTKLIEWTTYGNANILLLTVKNLVLYAAIVPALSMVSEDIKDLIVKRVMIAFAAVAFAQIIFSAALFVFFHERAFWTDDPYNGFSPFVGLFSNPNRFALFLNLAATALCAVLVTSITRFALLAATGLIVISISIFYTAALSQLIVYFGLLFYATALTAIRMRWRSLRLLGVAAASVIAIGLVGITFKSPFPDESHKEAALAWDLRNLASLAISGKTSDGAPFKFTSDSFVNRAREISNLMESFGLHSMWPSNVPITTETGTRRPLHQKLFGVPEHMAPASQSQFAYIYFRYGLLGLALFAGALLIPAISGLLLLFRSSDPLLLSYHLCLVAFIATFLGDNGLLDFPTNFLLFFVIFANQHLAPFRFRKPAIVFAVAGQSRI
ncbi:hypothetical protein [Bradyrhizobium sp. 18]|uniref:hypothetical protein n=1 Tax=Bradyrhizobium sp. 18 TaxID=2782657 RepID=UPI001FF80325|nr:hypothetical protein [Bradyrhizobium sp. 18]MCK1503850.1 hypothetical protein [Bradyrhizobium sp. 18]